MTSNQPFMKGHSFWEFLRSAKNFCRVAPLPDALKLALAEGKDREIQIYLRPVGRPIALRCATSDIICLRKVFLQEDYRSPFPIDPRIIIDAGANIGMATLFFAQQYPKAKIIAIEPERSNFQILQRNCAGLANVTLVEAALWPEHCTLTIKDPQAEKWSFSVTAARPESEPNSRKVRALTIPDLLQEFHLDHIDLLKLDIEGAEKELFNANAGSWLGSVGQIVIELHDRLQTGCARSFYAALVPAPFAQEVRGENIFIKLGH